MVLEVKKLRSESKVSKLRAEENLMKLLDRRATEEQHPMELVDGSMNVREVTPKEGGNPYWVATAQYKHMAAVDEAPKGSPGSSYESLRNGSIADLLGH